MEQTTLQQIHDSLGEYINSVVYEITLHEVKDIRGFGYVKNFKCRFFRAVNGNFCMQPLKRKRTGFKCTLTNEDILSIIKIGEPEKRAKTYDVLKNAKNLLKKIHGNAWKELKERLTKAVEANDASMLETEYMLQGKVKYRNVANDIAKYNDWRKVEILGSLKEAFEKSKPFNWRHDTFHKSGRDISIEVKPMPDGSVNAWFSSEYMACGNGDYYLLINPTTAIFCEKD